jgi:transcriptional regulator PpsR
MLCYLDGFQPERGTPIQAPLTIVNTAQPDITLMLDMDAVIREVTVSTAISGEGLRSWVGRAWIDTVADVGSDKVRRMVEDARNGGVSAFRQVTQRFPSGLELPIEYTTVRLGGKAGLIAVGKSLQAVSEMQSRLVAAQHAMEQDYWKLREVETRYRLLFDASNEAVLVLRADDLRVVEANPSAIRAFGMVRGWDFLQDMAPSEREPFRAMLGRVREQGKAPGIVAHLGPDRAGWILRASIMNGEPGAVFLLQLSPVAALPDALGQIEPPPLEALLERMPDAFVVLDREGIVRQANRAFVDLVQAGAEGATLGQSLARWLSQPGADMAVLLNTLRRHGTVRLFSTRLRGDLGTPVDVELSAVGDSDADPAFLGVVLRDVSRRLPDETAQSAVTPLGPYDGKTPLRKIVEEAVEVVERHYLESALRQADGNRTAAAELLGLSRQSLYTKINRYGLDSGT